MKRPLVMIAALTALLVSHLTVARAQTWVPSGPTNSWTSIASSADGSHLIVGALVGRQVLLSTNYGANWRTSTLPAIEWTAVASSADGTTLAAASSSGPLYLSTNSGSLWTTNKVPANNWSSLAMSADGKTLAAVVSVDGVPVYVTTNAGTSWGSTNVSGMPGATVSCSADGKRLAVLTDGMFFSSTNAGSTWTFMTHVGAANRNSPIASSADGQKLAVAFSTDAIYTSTNFGATWTSNNVPQVNWISIASSADGTKLVAVAGGGSAGSGPIYSSTDSGAIWTSNNVARQAWSAATSSADGCRLAAVTSSAGIWRAQLPLAEQLYVAPSSSNLVLSWVVPSTALALQQATDLVTGVWTAVPGAPALNLATLQYQSTVDPTNSQNFYRLSGQ